MRRLAAARRGRATLAELLSRRRSLHPRSPPSSHPSTARLGFRPNSRAGARLQSGAILARAALAVVHDARLCSAGDDARMREASGAVTPRGQTPGRAPSVLAKKSSRKFRIQRQFHEVS
eukprot:3036123-Prymnesium_polylepis.2